MKKIFEIALVVFFTLFITNVVVAGDFSSGSLRGEVVAIDHNTTMISLKFFPSGPAISPSDQGGFLIMADARTLLSGCGTAMDFDNIRVGDLVDIKYNSDGGWYVAEAIDVPRPLIACNLEGR